jgi:YD repeat-containing protein
MHRIASAKESSGRVVEYGYDQAGRLVHLRDAGYGDEFYEYDSLNQLTSVLDAQHRPLLGNAYDEFGRIRSQSLADGRKLLYECGYNENHQLASVRLILPNGYVVDWMLTRNGFVSSMPHPPANPDSTSPR